MDTFCIFRNSKCILGLVAIALEAGCATQGTVPPLYDSLPTQEAVTSLSLLEVPVPPSPKSSPVVINIPMEDVGVLPDNSIMRDGATIEPGASVVISVPAFVYQRSQVASSLAGDELGFRTDGYFNVLEQYIERALIAAGLQVKDRSKFEAKLRDLRDTGTAVRSSDDAFLIALDSLQRDLESGKVSREEFTEKAKQLRDKLLDPSRGSRGREEMTDISEVIRAAQDGEVIADYVLQVNELSVKPYNGTPLQLGTCKEVQDTLQRNPGLRLGPDERGAIPTTLPRPWAQARFNAKLIDVKTGSIDWIGEYSIESLAVLEHGINITIGVRQYPANAKQIVDAVSEHNSQVRHAYDRAVSAKRALDDTYREMMQPVRYEGPPVVGDAIQQRRRTAVAQAEWQYSDALNEYKETSTERPLEARMDWVYSYDVDTPVVIPDLLNPANEREQERLLEHVKALGFKVTHDLLRTVRITSGDEQP